MSKESITPWYFHFVDVIQAALIIPVKKNCSHFRFGSLPHKGELLPRTLVYFATNIFCQDYFRPRLMATTVTTAKILNNRWIHGRLENNTKRASFWRTQSAPPRKHLSALINISVRIRGKQLTQSGYLARR